MNTRIWGPLSPIGMAVAALIYLSDQLTKTLMLHGLGMVEGQVIPVTRFFEFQLVWNRGISYGLMQSHQQSALVIFSVLISLVLYFWLARSHRVVTAAALGLVIGGALGNASDRLYYGGVVDFLHFFWNDWSWYVFNIADVAIVAGVALLFYVSLTERHQPKGLGNA
jgi:signal peptidase II